MINKKDNKNKSKQLSPSEAMLSMAKALHKVGAIDQVTMHEFETLALDPVIELSPKEIKALRNREKVSQPIFAKYLNTAPSTIKKWETGEKHPRGTSLKLLNLVLKGGLRSIA